METEAANCSAVPAGDSSKIPQTIQLLLDRAERQSGGRTEVSEAEFRQLLNWEGSTLNGIRNTGQENGLFKTQCRVELEGRQFFFDVFTAEEVDWQNQ